MGSIFIYFYRGYAEVLVNSYIAKITVCENILDEETCYAKEFCEGIYGPTCPDCSDNVFRRCQRMPSDVSVQLDQAQARCEQTGGQWYRDQRGSFCLCQVLGLKKVFDSQRGCIND